MSIVENSKKLRVCIIGGGAAGLCAIKHLTRETSNFETALFEQNNDIGGTWIYDERIGRDDNGYPIHSSMYENLTTNLPVKIMNFPDYQKLGETSDDSCGSHRDVLNYLRDYANHFQLRPYMQFNTRVENVRPVINKNDWKKTIWKVRTKNINTQAVEEKEFDAIMVCNGHYFEPNIPKISGIETFPGDTMHSHDYRNAKKYFGKSVVVLGAASSGIDIGIELTSEASHVYLSHNHNRIMGPLPKNMSQVAGVERIINSEFILRDGEIIKPDCFIYCTGYKYSFPFLDGDCMIKIDENYVSPLYKHLINIENPSMCIVGIPTTVIPFALFHMQVQYFMAVLKGHVTLPTKEEMLEDSALKSRDKRHAHVFDISQFDYNDYLATSGGFSKLPVYYKNGYIAWKNYRHNNLLNYKKSKFLICPDNTNVEIIAQDSEAKI